MEYSMKIYFVCSVCGSTDVTAEAWAEWNKETQGWIVSSLQEHGHDWCNDCEEHVDLVGKNDGLELEEEL